MFIRRIMGYFSQKKIVMKQLVFDCIILTIISFVIAFFLLGRFDLWKSILHSIIFVFVSSIIPWYKNGD